MGIIALFTTIGTACTTEVTSQTQSYYRSQEAVALSRVAIAYAEVGEPDQATQLLTQALNLANSIDEANSSQYKSRPLIDIAIAYAKTRQYEQALNLVKPLQDDVYGKIALHQIILIASEAGDYNQALQMSQLLENDVLGSDSMTSDYSTPETLAAIASQATQTEPKNVAISILNQAIEASKTLRENIQQSQAIGKIAVNYAKVGQSAKAAELLDQARQLLGTETFFERAALAELAVNYAQIGQQAKAVEVLNQARQNATTPDIVVKYAQIGQSAQALTFLDQALQTVKANQRSASNKYTELNEIAGYYAKLGQFDRAFELAELIDQWYPRSGSDLGGLSTEAYTEITIKYAEIGQPSRAFQVAQNIKYKSLRATALTHIANAYIQAGNYDQALQLVQSLNGESFSGLGTGSYQVDILTNVATQAAQVEPNAIALQICDQALRVADSIQSEDERVGAMAAIASQYDRAGQPAQALKQLEELQNQAKAIEG